MRQKINYKNAGFQLGIGVLAYFLFLKPKVDQPKKPTLIVGDLYDDGLDYQSTYFKQSEYFGKNEIPSEYQKNYTNLVRVLDKIRGRFGSPILISKGFERSGNGVISNGFQNCTSVVLQAQNNNGTLLKNVIDDMVRKGEISLIELNVLSSNQIKITKDA